jgi:hypothetical protein
MWLNKLKYMLHLGFLYKFLEVTDLGSSLPCNKS